MDLFNRKKVRNIEAAAFENIKALKLENNETVKALEAKVDGLASLNKKSYYSSYGSVSCNDINDLKNFITDQRYSVSPKVAYDLYDRAAPLSNAVDKIAGAVANLNPMIRTKNGELVEGSKILDTLKDPGFGQSQQQFILDYAISYLLTRNGYLITDPFKRTLRTVKAFDVDVDANNADGYAEEIRVSAMNRGTQISFLRDITNGKWTFVDRFNQQIFHLKGQTTNNGLLGRSPVESILVDISQNIEGGNHNLSLLVNGMRSSGLFATDGELSDDQYERLKEQIDQEYTGAAKAGKPLVTDGGIVYSEMGKTNKDMDYATVIKLSKIEVASRYNIPIPIISADNQTLSNYTTAVEAFYDDAVFPIAELLFNAIGNALDIDENQVLTFDKDEIPAIRQRRIREAADRHGIGVFTDNETREGLGFESYPEGDVVYKPVNLLPAGTEDGARDQGEIEATGDEEKAFKKACMDIGLTKQASAIEWLKLK